MTDVILTETAIAESTTIELVESVSIESVVSEVTQSESVDVTTTEIVETETVTVEIIEVGIPGPRGPMGLPGEITIDVVAGENLSGHRAVQLIANLAWYCDVDTVGHTGKAVGVTVGAALVGQIVSVQCMGSITEPSWSFTEGPVYVGNLGQLTQTIGGLFVQQIGIATSSNTLNINPQMGIIRSL